MIGSSAARLRWRAVLILLTVAFAALTTGVAAHSPAGAQTPGTPLTLARLEIDIWPEFDKPSSALVILRAEIAADVALPVTVSLRIPAASGGPTAVATAGSANTQLLTLPYERSDVQVDFMTISFQASDRFFHVEFYDPIGTDSPERQYSYMWTGDLPAAQVTVQLQEPAGASAVSVTPDLGAPAQGGDAMNYREADLGALEAGKSLVVDVQYTKTSLSTSAEILGLEQDAPPSASTGGSNGTSTMLLILAGVGTAAILVAAAALLVQRWLAAAAASAPVSRVQRRRAKAASKGPFCSKCGSTLAAGDRFCASCGHAAKSGH